jgi:hypothetical protein
MTFREVAESLWLSKMRRLAILITALFLMNRDAPMLGCKDECAALAKAPETSPCRSSSAAPPSSLPKAQHPEHRDILSSIFWVGETTTEESHGIDNRKSAWKEDWLGSFGGNDNPEPRAGFCPCEFEPKENPFYVALPYNDLDETGDRKESAEQKIPWLAQAPRESSAIQDRWVEVTAGSKRCYGQVEDVGPNLDDDVEYVFGSARPSNAIEPKAGIDLSPALALCLEITSGQKVNWRFVDPPDVPKGPWLSIVTNSK